MSETGRGLCKLAFGLNGSGSKSPAWCHQDILHGLCAQKILKPLVTPILRKYFICVKMPILYLRTKYPNPAHSHQQYLKGKQGLELPKSVCGWLHSLCFRSIRLSRVVWEVGVFLRSSCYTASASKTWTVSVHLLWAGVIQTKGWKLPLPTGLMLQANFAGFKWEWQR